MLCLLFTHRETEEECGLVVRDLVKVGVIMFEFSGQPQLMEVHVFRTTCYSGQPIETEGKVEGSMNTEWSSFHSLSLVVAHSIAFWLGTYAKTCLVCT